MTTTAANYPAATRQARRMQNRKLCAAGDSFVAALKRFRAATGPRRVQLAYAVQARWAQLERALEEAGAGTRPPGSEARRP